MKQIWNIDYRLRTTYILSSIELIINSNDIVDNDNSIVLDSVHTVIVKNMEGLSGQQLNCLCVRYPNADSREG